MTYRVERSYPIFFRNENGAICCGKVRLSSFVLLFFLIITIDVQLRQRIDLIQDFVMPTVCTRVHTSKDGQYIYTAGTYKPR